MRVLLLLVCQSFPYSPGVQVGATREGRVLGVAYITPRSKLLGQREPPPRCALAVATLKPQLQH